MSTNDARLKSALGEAVFFSYVIDQLARKLPDTEEYRKVRSELAKTDGELKQTMQTLCQTISEELAPR